MIVIKSVSPIQISCFRLCSLDSGRALDMMISDYPSIGPWHTFHILQDQTQSKRLILDYVESFLLTHPFAQRCNKICIYTKTILCRYTVYMKKQTNLLQWQTRHEGYLFLLGIFSAPRASFSHSILREKVVTCAHLCTALKVHFTEH